jgi:diguanylate cyclase (GGDEF)-like protein
MTFDVSTLTFAGGIVGLASGLILFLNWSQDRTAWAAFWWASATSGLGVGVTMLALHEVLPPFVSNIVGPLVLNVCAALTWVAARIFNRGSAELRKVIAGVGVWIAALVFAGASGHDRLAVAFGAGLSACLYAAGAIEFWLARAEKLRGRWPMISVLCLQAVALALAVVEFSSSPLSSAMPSNGIFGIINFEGLLYTSGSAIFLVMMLKDRSEARHKAAALIDPLTGLANRRAFMDRAQRLFDRTGQGEAPVALLAFDLDRFKKVNDTFGHPAGDHVLRIFADVLSRTLRPADLAGRIGGEEFCTVLPGCSAEGALAIARRIRSSFQEDARFVNGQPIGATVSVGVAIAPEHGSSLTDLIASADGALYRSKDMGRNRVTLAERNSDTDPPVVIRIA